MVWVERQRAKVESGMQPTLLLRAFAAQHHESVNQWLQMPCVGEGQLYKVKAALLCLIIMMIIMKFVQNDECQLVFIYACIILWMNVLMNKGSSSRFELEFE